MIPKIVHRVWMSDNDELPDRNTKIGQCFYSQEKLKDYGYEIRTYNATNFDCSISKFLLQAYALRKWAFVADYIRLWVLYHHGGIYMDTDVEVIKPLDELLDLPYFCGARYAPWVNKMNSTSKVCPLMDGLHSDVGFTFDSGCIGFEKHNPLIKLVLDYYDNNNFIDDDLFIHDKFYRGDGFLEDYIEYKITKVITHNGYKKHLIDDLAFYRECINESDINSEIFVLNTPYLNDANYHIHESENEECICIHYGLGSWIDRTKEKRLKLSDYTQEEQDNYYQRYNSYKFDEKNNIYNYTFNPVEK